ncbi:efflux RND transporter periplasmic adaptor subunit [Luteimonas sp. FXH3W]|uniref:Efflux RND transporter periplasmic adaptor subunit n=1 Tax=Aquilutibacter rugosus TaxID=3115820 RepID=A0ABU7UZK5_9GAMM
MMNRISPSRTGVAFALALAVMTAVPACKKAEKDDAKTDKIEAVPVEVTAVRTDSVSNSFSGTAPLEAKGEAQVVAKTSGVARQVLFEEGQFVRAGQTMVRLESDRQRLQVQQASAQVEKLQRDYARAEALAREQLIARSDLDRIRFELANARSTLNLAQLELSYTNVTAPISGTVASRSIKTGNFVQISSPIYRIVSSQLLEAVINVPEAEKSKLQVGLPVQMTVDAMPGQTFEGRISRIAPVVDSGSGTFRAVAAFPGGVGLQPGMFGRLSVAFDQHNNAMLVPRAALLEGEQNSAVFVVRNGKAVRAPITTGYSQGEWIEVRSGITTQDRVITAGKAAVRDGMPVTVLAPAAPQTTAPSPATR